MCMCMCMCMPNKALEAKFWLHSRLVGRLNTSTFLCGAQQHVPLHLALVHEALAAELAGVPRLATVHSLLMSSELHLAVKHLATQCTPPIYLMKLVVLGLLGRIQFGRDLGQL